MIQRLLEQEKAITQVLGADRAKRHLVLSWQDIQVSDGNDHRTNAGGIGKWLVNFKQKKIELHLRKLEYYGKVFLCL